MDGSWQSRGLLGVPVQVMADVEVEVAVAVQVGEGRRGRPVAVAAQPGRVGDVLERAVAAVAIEGVGPPAGDEQVGVGRRCRSRRRPRRGRSPGRRRCPSGSVTSSKVPSPRLRKRRSPGGARSGRGGNGPPWTAVDVEPAVAVVVEQRHAAAGLLGELVERRLAVVVDEAQAGGLGVVGERGDDASRTPGPARPPAARPR